VTYKPHQQKTLKLAVIYLLSWIWRLVCNERISRASYFSKSKSEAL